MSLILRAQVASAAHAIVPARPLDSFVAVNPLAGHESRPFESASLPGAATTRPLSAYSAEFLRGRITTWDLEQAILERVPELENQTIQIGTTPTSAASLAALDMRLVASDPRTADTPAAPPSDSDSRWLDEYLSVWIASYLCPTPVWPMPHKSDGFYRAWQTLVGRDTSLPRAVRRALIAQPAEPDAALAFALTRLGITDHQIPDALRNELAHLHGWVAHIKWRAATIGDIDLVSYLAVRFSLRAAFGIPPTIAGTVGRAPAAVPESQLLWERAERVASAFCDGWPSREAVAAAARVVAAHPISDQGHSWQKAYELHYRYALLADLRNEPGSPERPELQLVMCIDPRSEGLRRHLEEDPHVETFGFAGFFGVPIRFARFGARGAIDSLPALLSARHRLTEEPVDKRIAQKVLAAGRVRNAFRRAIHTADSAAATPFAFAETAGWFYGAVSILRTLTPRLYAQLSQNMTRASRELDSEVTIAESFTLEERAAMVETAVRMMGMARFAPLVVLAGHGSQTENNLYQAALDCGACGGNPGRANARAAAAMFNDPEVRLLLAERDIHIPSDTFFVAAEHNTVTDLLRLLDRHLIPPGHTERAERFDDCQQEAADLLVTERARQLPGATSRHSPQRLRGRAHDWAEVYPELGLAGSAAMVIGPRDMTRGVNLGRRVFLHSYLTDLDPTGTALETILTAPLVVAQWINHQYYFSAINPDTLGAGTKTIHNAIGTLGVISGHSGDLRRGLPWQSVGLGDELFHEPMRLAVTVEAPLARIGTIISRNQVLRDLLDNDWITLGAREHRTAPWHRYTSYGFTPAIPTEGPAT